MNKLSTAGKKKQKQKQKHPTTKRFPNIYVVLFALSETVGFPDSSGRRCGRVEGMSWAALSQKKTLGDALFV